MERDYKIFIREATFNDVEKIVEIEKASFKTPWSKWMFVAELQSRNSKLFVAEMEKEILGYICLWILPGEAQIANIAVSPKFRRRGIGKSLLCRGIKESVKAGAKKVLLEVRKSNKTAFSLYEKFGFKVLGIRKGYYSDTGEDAFVMEKDVGEEVSRSRSS